MSATVETLGRTHGFQPSRGERIVVDTALLRRFDVRGPRYTSYPTADRFVEAFDVEAYRSWATRRNIGGVQRPLSLYLHLPFCPNVCFYCGCNKIVTRDAAKGTKYLKYLFREIEMQAGLLRADPGVSQMHWGGGTPNFFSGEQIRGLMAKLESCFDFAPHGEYSIELDPRGLDEPTVEALAQCGFNRVSIGVQDFDEAVQRAVNRLQGEDLTRGAIEMARRHGFRSVNLDLIYGLPKQTLASIEATIGKVISMSPDRIALYNYAHIPALFKPQRRIDEAALPDATTKIEMFRVAVERLTAAGYVYIGMDHFARPEDDLAEAQRQGRLARNFQGYSTHAECDIVGMGVSAIGMIGPTYSQNRRDLADYYGDLDRGSLPVARGIELTADDLARRAVIHGLMCNMELSKRAIETAWLLDFDRYFAAELRELEVLEDAGIVELDADWITVTPVGRFLVRSVGMVFDRYLRLDRERRAYSRVI